MFELCFRVIFDNRIMYVEPDGWSQPAFSNWCSCPMTCCFYASKTRYCFTTWKRKRKNCWSWEATINRLSRLATNFRCYWTVSDALTVAVQIYWPCPNTRRRQRWSYVAIRTWKCWRLLSVSPKHIYIYIIKFHRYANDVHSSEI